MPPSEESVALPGQVAQWVETPSQHTKDAGSIPRHGTYKTQPMHTSVREQQTMFLFSLSL